MWGEGIIGAVKMEEMGVPGRVHISDATARLIGEEFSLSVAHEEMEPSFAASYAIAKSFVVEPRPPSVSMDEDNMSQLSAQAAVEKALERSEEAATGHTRARSPTDKEGAAGERASRWLAGDHPAGGDGKLKPTSPGTQWSGRPSSSVRYAPAATVSSRHTRPLGNMLAANARSHTVYHFNILACEHRCQACSPPPGASVGMSTTYGAPLSTAKGGSSVSTSKRG